MKIKWGVIGSAGIALRRTIPEGIIPAHNAELAAVYDINREANTVIGREHNAIAHSKEEELLASDVDAVYIATPAWLHYKQVLRAVDAGKHILCEKPLALSVPECRTLVEACKEAGIHLGVGFMMRYQSQHREALRMVRDGRLGTPVFARAQLSCWYPPIPDAWRQNPEQGGGGSLMDLGGHCIDLLELFMGRVVAVQCSTSNLVHGYSSEDTAVALLEFVSGAKGVVDCLFNVPDASSRNRLELYGSRGSILAEGTIGQGEKGVMIACIESDQEDYAAQQQRATGEGIRIDPPPVNMYRAEIEAFSQSILDNSEPPVDGYDGLWSQAVINACYESAQNGTRIAVSV